MGTAQYDPAALGRRAWNAGWKVGVKKPLKQRQIWAIRFFLDREGACEAGRCSISRSTASYEAAISLRSRSEPSSRARRDPNPRHGYPSEIRTSCAVRDHGGRQGKFACVA